MWFDVMAKEEDVATVTDFYRTVFEGPIGPDDSDSPYMSWIMNGDTPWAAVVKTDDDAQVGRWVPYVHVEDLDAAVEAAVAAGATVIQPRTTGPAGDATVIADPIGAHLALWVPAAA